MAKKTGGTAYSLRRCTVLSGIRLFSGWFSSPGICFPFVGDEDRAVFVVPFFLEQAAQGFRVLIRVQRRFPVVRIGPHPSGVYAEDIQVRILFEIVVQRHGEHIEGCFLRAVIQVERPVAFPDASGFRGNIDHQRAGRALFAAAAGTP